MGSLTQEMTQKIRERYSVLLSYSKVGKELGIDARTVKRHVENSDSSQQHAAVSNSPEDSRNGIANRGRYPRGAYDQVSGEILYEELPSHVVGDPEYQKFKKSSELNLPRFSGKLVEGLRDINHPWIKGITHSYDTKGYLTEDECLQLVQYAISYKSNPTTMRENDLSKDWVAIPCDVCGRLAAIVDREFALQLIQLFPEWKGWSHTRCENMMLMRARAR